MATVSLVWTEGDRLRVANPGGEDVTSIGRGADSSIVLADPTASRLQAVLRPLGGRYRLENLSETNPTRLNGERVVDAVDLSDGDKIGAGNSTIVFHDLTAVARISGPVCSHCGRENEGEATHCWFCGTSLVNTLSVARRRLRVAFRAVRRDGAVYDVYSGEALRLNGSDGLAIHPAQELAEGTSALEAGDLGPILRMSGASSSISVNGQTGAAESPLADGDELEFAGGRLVILVRDPG